MQCLHSEDIRQAGLVWQATAEDRPIETVRRCRFRTPGVAVRAWPHRDGRCRQRAGLEAPPRYRNALRRRKPSPTKATHRTRTTREIGEAQADGRETTGTSRCARQGPLCRDYAVELGSDTLPAYIHGAPEAHPRAGGTPSTSRSPRERRMVERDSTSPVSGVPPETAHPRRKCPISRSCSPSGPRSGKRAQPASLAGRWGQGRDAQQPAR